jgi:amicoumacin kinase
MEQSVSKYFNEPLIQQALCLFQLDDHYKVIGDFENYVLEVYKKNCPYILRFTHSSHRTLEEVRSEIDWMKYLYEQGIRIPKVFPSIHSLFVEAIRAGDTFFYVTLTEKAKGTHVKISNDQDHRPLFYQIGKLIGKMHQVTKKYIPSNGIQSRPHWEEDDLLEIEKYIPNEQVDVIQNGKKIIEKVRNLSKDSNVYGLCHTDIHSGNFFVDNGDICVFDFDDTMNCWFAHDIAIPIYYACLYGMKESGKKERTKFGNELFHSLMEGYRTEHNLDPDAIKTIPLFFQLRDITLYTVLYKKLSLEQLEGPVSWLVKDLKERIIQNDVLIDLNI